MLLLALAACFLLLALVMVGVGMFLGLQPALGSAWAAALTALLPLFIGGALLWTAVIIRK